MNFILNNYKFLFALSASVFSILCFPPYIRDIFKGTTKPHKYSWLIWTILQSTGAIIIFNESPGWGAMSLAIGAIFCGYIFFLSLSRGTKNITKFDTICLIGALLALGVWVFLKNPIISIVLVSLIDFIGFLPTLIKAYKDPESETKTTYLLSVFSVGLSLIALVEYNFSTVIYLLSLFITNLVCVLLIYFSSQQKTNNML